MPDPSARPLAARPKLRVGVMLDSLSIRQWNYKILHDIQNSGFSEVVLVVINQLADQPLASAAPAVGWRRLQARWKQFWAHGMYRRYEAWDYRRYKTSPDALEAVSCRDLFGDDQILHVTPERQKWTDRFSNSDVERIKAANLDVMLRFGFRIIRGEILLCARYGVWSFHHGDSRQYRGGPPLFWEIYEGNPVSGTVLQVLTDELDAGKVLYRSWSSTSLDSLYLNRNETYWKTSHFVLRRLRQLQEGGEEALRNSDRGPDKGRIYRSPDNWRMMRFVGQRALRVAGRRLRRLVYDEPAFQWFVAWRARNAPEAPWHRAIAPHDRFYADPFLIERDGRTWLFIEEFFYATNKGVISVMEISPDGRHSEPRIVLEHDTHLSYPFVFERGGQVYMIPETKARKSIELYRATEFPYRWTLDRVLVSDVSAVDATLHEQDGRWWLFCNMPAYGASSQDELSLYVADSFEGPWRPHPANPVTSDVRSARPAGGLYRLNGELIRPAQDCSVDYGHAIVLNRVDVLSETEYRETALRRMDNDWVPGNLGSHTLNFSERWEVRDGKRARRRIGARSDRARFEKSRS